MMECYFCAVLNVRRQVLLFVGNITLVMAVIKNNSDMLCSFEIKKLISYFCCTDHKDTAASYVLEQLVACGENSPDWVRVCPEDHQEA